MSGIIQICVGILLMLVLQQQAGMAGDVLNDVLTFFFGSWGMIFPAFLVVSGIAQTLVHSGESEVKKTTGLAVCFLCFLGIAHMNGPADEIALNRDELAGAVGFMMSFPFILFATKIVGYVVLTTGLLIGLFIAFEPDIPGLIRTLQRLRKEHAASVKRETKERKRHEREKSQIKELFEEDEDPIEQDTEAPELNIVRPVFAQQTVRDASKDKADEESKAEKGAAKSLDRDTLQMKDTRFEEWTFPSYDLLDPSQSELTVDDEELKRQAKLIEEKLEEFGIDVTMRDAHPGPTVTQFTLQPAEGVKLSKIGALKDDLALALAAQSLRIEAPIPGKSLVGIEMPNSERTIVHLREILESPEFTQSSSSLALPLGRDVSGSAVVANLDEMPHLLIAGATGSGKSVCMNTFLTALLYQNAPHELKFILIDPKRVELMPYDNIPHLLTPVITESEKALQALRWAVAEMGRRLHRFSEAGARNIEEYNEKQIQDDKLLPRIIIVIDELADLMMRQFKRDTETMVARIAQMARAVGMHLIIATQRPSVDVITGLIKANIPTRIAFRTVSAIDGRTILDEIGSEDLLGRGDMLYKTATTPKPIRIQGIFISTKETERVINAVKIAGGGEITEQIPIGSDEEDDEEGGVLDGMIDLDADDNGGDDMFFEAVRVVREYKKASASLLQRQLKVGYARAARLLDIMEEKGLIGPVDGAKARQIYSDRLSAYN